MNPEYTGKTVYCHTQEIAAWICSLKRWESHKLQVCGDKLAFVGPTVGWKGDLSHEKQMEIANWATAVACWADKKKHEQL